MTLIRHMDTLSYEIYTKPEHKEWIVFVHGAGGSSRTFGRQVAAFRKHFNLLIPDLRDHGNSKKISPVVKDNLSFEVVARDILNLMDNLNIEKAHFIGISMGSVIIRVIEEIRPHALKSIIIGGGIMKLNRRTHLLFKSGAFLSKFLPYHKLYQLVAWILMPYENHKVARRLFIREASKIQNDAFKVWLGLLTELKNRLDKSFNRPLKSPTLMITGSQDFAFIEECINYARKFPVVNLHILPSCGHVCNIEQPDEFNRQSLNFLLQNS